MIWTHCDHQTRLQALATVVSDHMGGAQNHQSLSEAYSDFQAQLKDRLHSRMLPIGSLAVGLPRHRALLFKTLADACELPCRMLRGSAIGRPNLIHRNCHLLLQGACQCHYKACLPPKHEASSRAYTMLPLLYRRHC